MALPNKSLFIVLLVFFGIWPVNCGYHFSGGGTLPAGVGKVFVSIFENRTSETGLENMVTQSIIYEFTRRKTAASQERADAMLSGVIKSMETRSISRKSDETTLERRVILFLDLKLTDREGGVIWSRSGISESEAYDVSEDKLGTENNRRQALGKLSERLGEKIYGQLTEDF